MSNPLVSIIVPIYNVEQYLFRCVQSLKEQTLKDIEIILVDDGSPDNCGFLCDTFSEGDPRIITIHKENGGLPSARNVGLEIAKGEYVGFVDSDDWVSLDMFEKLYQIAKAQNADVAICDYFMVSTSCIVALATNKPTTSVGEMLLNDIKPLAWNKIYRRALNLYFYEGLKFGEDRPTVIPILTRCKCIAYVKEPLYYYFQRSGSIIDGYARNVSFPYDIQSMRLMIQNSAPRYSKQIAKYCVDIIKWTITRRPSSKAEMIEFLQEIYPMLRQNRFLIKDAKSIQPLLLQETIPKRLVVFDDKSKHLCSKSFSICRESWKKYGVGLEITEIGEAEYDIIKLPKCVRYAYSQNDMEFVNGYFRLRYIYEYGGIALDSSIRLNAPLGELRANSTFFGFINDHEISKYIFGSIAKSKVLEDILETYEMDSILNDDSNWSLSDRIFTILKQYGMNENGKGKSQQLKEDIKIYGYEYLSCKLNSKINIAYFFDETIMLAEEKGTVIVDSNISESFLDDFSRGNATSIKSLQYKVQTLQREVDRLKNSKSWKFTRPLRIFFNLFRKIKYSEKEVM